MDVGQICLGSAAAWRQSQEYRLVCLHSRSYLFSIVSSASAASLCLSSARPPSSDGHHSLSEGTLAW